MLYQVQKSYREKNANFCHTSNDKTELSVYSWEINSEKRFIRKEKATGFLNSLAVRTFLSKIKILFTFKDYVINEKYCFNISTLIRI